MCSSWQCLEHAAGFCMLTMLGLKLDWLAWWLSCIAAD